MDSFSGLLAEPSSLEHEEYVLSAVIQNELSELLIESDSFSDLFVKEEHKELLRFISESKLESFIFQYETLLKLLDARHAVITCITGPLSQKSLLKVWRNLNFRRALGR
jgi:hypothetical protein